MADSISAPESRVVQSLVNKGLPPAEALVVIILLARTYARPKGELVETLRQYPQLEKKDTVGSAIESLLKKNWLEVVTTYGVDLISQHPNLRNIIATYLGDPSVEEILLNLRRVHDENVEIIGPLSDAKPYLSYLGILKTAQSHIYYVGIATAAFDHDVTPILQERARAGVSVKVLLATPSLAGRLRGPSMLAIAQTRLEEWRKVSGQIREFEVRVTNERDDLLLAASSSIDGRIARLVVYDFLRERSKQGTVVEFSRSDSQNLNIVHHIERSFLSSWSHARPLDGFSAFVWALTQYWQFLSAALLVLASLLVYGIQDWLGSATMSESNQVISVAILTSLAASLAFAGMIDLGGRIVDARKRAAARRRARV